ncbi:eamA-like transporter family protein [Burkholderia pseudomallei MSHR332]|nr:eamA-like transporter family protein [Burkholderia pseudomallei MSHR332]
MASVRPALAAHGATSLFVLLWSSGAIFAELGLRHASAFAFLIARFALASLVLLVLSLARRRWLPPRGARRATLATGLLLTGGYSILYLLALERGLAPGILATILGVQPILTLAVLERRASPARLAGLALALTGLSLVVYRSAAGGAAPAAGTACALGALLAITAGALLQKRVRAAPIDVLPLQNALGLALCALIAPFEPISFESELGVRAAARLARHRDLRVRAVAVLPADAARRSRQRNEPVLSRAGRDRADGRRVARQPSRAAGNRRHDRDPRRPRARVPARRARLTADRDDGEIGTTRPRCNTRTRRSLHRSTG